MGQVSAVAWLVMLGACRIGFEDQASDVADATSNVARVTIQHNGDGFGLVSGPDGFTCTTGTCTLDVPIGTTVTLRGLAAASGWFEGWTSQCGGNFDCTFQANTSATIVADFTPIPNRVFVTSTTTTGAFGGIAGADAICATRATAAGLTGTYVAFLSDTSTSAISRVANSRGWIRVDGAPYADAPTAFSDGKILFPPRLDEYGNDIGNVQIYTGSNWGVTSTNLCSNWTSAAGMGGMAQTQYASSSVGTSDRACSTAGHLLCVETGRVRDVELRPMTSARLAFSTKTGWTPGAGRASADAHCANEAASAGIPGDFLAAMATTTESIASRFPPGEIYRRVDGALLLRGGGFFVADWLDLPPEEDQLGARISADVWTGVTRFSALPTAVDNCNDWTSSATAQSGAQHLTTRTDVRTPTKTSACSNAAALLCLEH